MGSNKCPYDFELVKWCSKTWEIQVCAGVEKIYSCRESLKMSKYNLYTSMMRLHKDSSVLLWICTQMLTKTALMSQSIDIISAQILFTHSNFFFYNNKSSIHSQTWISMQSLFYRFAKCNIQSEALKWFLNIISLTHNLTNPYFSQ